MNDIREKQYNNLRKYFNENLINPILGKNYYNMGQDVYTADQYTTEDIKSKFDGMKSDIKFYKILFIISLIANGLFILYKK